MADIDLYTLLESYAKKFHSPYIDLDKFIHYVEKSAQRLSAAHPEWLPWSTNTEKKIWEILPVLVKEEKCKLNTNTKETQIFLSTFYINVIRQAYTAGETAEMPFPDEKTLKLNIAPDQLRVLYIEHDLGPYMENPQETILPIIKFTFPRDLPDMIILSDLIPRRLSEMTMLKVQKYLWVQGNKEHIQSKMISRFQGREDYLKDMINYMMTQPMNCLYSIESGGELSFLFFSFFCNLVKGEVLQKNELTVRDIAILQAVYILEILNNYHTNKVVRAKARETALKNLGLCFDKPPYLYNLSAIMKFSDSKGIPLLGQYSQEDLETFLKTKVTEHAENELPELLIVHDPAGEQFFVKKTVILLLCSRFLTDARPGVKKMVSERWFKLLKAYDREPAMDNDEDFERLLHQMTRKVNPMLLILLRDNKLALTYHELEKSTKLSETSKLFEDGKVLPLSVLLLLDRRAILSDSRMLLPFWYSIPILVHIITFFKNLGKRKNAQNAQDDEETLEPESYLDTNTNLSSVLKDMAAELIPQGKTLAETLGDHEARWNTRLNPQARKNLVEDVNSYISDRMRQLMRLPKKPKITRDFLEETAESFVSESSTLQQLGDYDALIAYIKLYIINLLQNRRI
ncbi:hypothetical protein LQZ21_13205 [Treponema sp. TIM-1]|uniref:hypothetical protein n=1 Tax=Treponema sp. TIM-1 TaxID=2898417 RepID=UPI00397E9E9F